MDLKKYAPSEQIPYCVSVPSTSRKVVSGLGLCAVATFIIFSVLLYNFSFKAPLLIQGFNSLGVNNTSLLSWPFSFNSAEKWVQNGSHNAEFSSGVDSSGKLLDSDREKVGLEQTHVGNLSDNLGNGSFVERKNNGVNGSEEGSGKEIVTGNLSFGNLSEKVINESFPSAKKLIGYNVSEGEVDGKSIVEDNNVGNLTSIGKVARSKGEVKIVGKAKNSGDLVEETRGQNVPLRECDIYDGRWVRDDSKPYYPTGSCPYIDKDFDCHLNGRPEDEYVRWKWQPYRCDIPSMNATDFLERLRGKKLVFVGDSLNRNMWESLVCILRHSVHNKKQVYEISGKSEFKKKGFYAFRFKDYNCTVDFVGAPFLVRESFYKSRNGSFETLRLDLMDMTTSMYRDADILIFNTGHWWTHEKTSRGEDYYQEGKHVHPRLKVLEAYKRALTTWGRWIDKNIDGNRTQIIFRGYSVTHFRGGRWNSGGQCDKETEPIYNETYLTKYPSKMRALEHVLQGMETPIMYMNISRLTDYRKDGHPSIHRRKYKTVQEQVSSVHAQDCSHWCLPGVPDTWNELLYVSLLKAGTGSWRY